MIDLETLLTNKQDELRGRPRDWLDDFKHWRTNVDWVSLAIMWCGIICFGATLIQIIAIWNAP